jgi:chemotaxis response regulator CheB
MPETKPNAIRVLGVDDSATMRELFARLIEAQPDMELVGSAAGGRIGGADV